MCTQFTFAQQFNFANIGTNKGLPSSECYGMMQDTKGYLWVRTLNGLSKFDGKKFINFTKKEGLKNNAVYAIYEDAIGRIWFATASSHIGYILNDSIHYLQCSESFAKENGYGQKVFFQILTDKENNVYVSSHERAYKIIAIGNYRDYTIITQSEAYLKIVDINKQYFCIPDTTGKIQPLKKLNFSFSILNSRFEREWDLVAIKQGISRTTYPCIDKKGSLFFNINNKVYCVLKNGKIEEYIFENNVFHIFIDKDNNLWVGLNSGGLLMFKNSNMSSEAVKLLSNESISGIIQDFEGGIWVSSLNKGLFYCKNLFNANLINDTLFNYKPEMLKIIDSTLFVSDFKSNIISYNVTNRKVNCHKIDFEKAKQGILDIDKIDNNYLLSGRNSIYKVDQNFKLLDRVFWEKNYKLSAGAYNTIITSNSKILGISKNYLVDYNIGKNYRLPSYGNDIIEFNNDIFVATKNGLLQYAKANLGSFKTYIANENVIKLLKLKTNLLAICRDGSVYSFDINLNNNKFTLGKSSFNDACIYENQRLFIASNFGIYDYNLSNNKFQLVNSSDGILDNEVFKIAAFNNTAFYSTIHGLGTFEINQFKENSIAPKINLIQTNFNNGLKFKAGQTLDYNSSLYFKFDLISFKEVSPIKIYYILKGYNNQWQWNENGEINYTNLPNGEYSLWAYAKNEAGINSNLIKVPFKIQIPFFKTTWFILFLIGILVLITFAIFKITYHFINKREVNKTRINKMIAEYQLMGLKAQMNPHFIFNCLNSIQKYVLDHNSKQAYTYMAKFSKLIRHVLDISDKTFVALSDELELVKIYVELEQLRFDRKFEFEININESIKTDDVIVPSLLIQPYLENAIWHGIMNLKDDTKGIIKINATAIHENIEIVIQDNGIGRTKAKLISQSTHQSKGMSINQKRIEAINYLLKTHNATIEIIDLYDQFNYANGTLVKIKLPLKYDE